MFGSDREIVELFFLYIAGPVHALSCFALAAVAFVVAHKFTVIPRALVLGANVLLAAYPIHLALAMSNTNRQLHAIAQAIAAAEGVALVALALGLFVRRPRPS